jgi:hypothetical protein
MLILDLFLILIYYFEGSLTDGVKFILLLDTDEFILIYELLLENFTNSLLPIDEFNLDEVALCEITDDINDFYFCGVPTVGFVLLVKFYSLSSFSIKLYGFINFESFLLLVKY